jgi:phosphoribosylanthranilate isomerase
LRIKICGITNLEDALYAVECGADALGFVFYEKSPRYISILDARKIVEALPPFVERVGLFVNEDATTVNKICAQAGVSTAQIHFDIKESYLDELNIKSLPVVRAKAKEDIDTFKDKYRLIDAYCEAYGGEGKRLNLEWFEGIDCSKIILAGGLSPENLKELKSFGFYGVDVSSGVESIKGKKDPMKVKQFIKNAKSI